MHFIKFDMFLFASVFVVNTAAIGPSAINKEKEKVISNVKCEISQLLLISSQTEPYPCQI